MEFTALTKFAVYAGALLFSLCLAGCAPSASEPPSSEEVEAFRGKPMPESVRAKMRARQTAAPPTEATPEP